jgi:hypothetical protein
MNLNNTKVIERKFLYIKPKLYFTKDISEKFLENVIYPMGNLDKKVHKRFYFDQLLAKIQANVYQLHSFQESIESYAKINIQENK